jgi:hypothetical protein
VEDQIAFVQPEGKKLTFFSHFFSFVPPSLRLITVRHSDHGINYMASKSQRQEMSSQLMTVGGIAAASGAPAPTIRSWVRKGLVQCTRDSTGRRLFDQRALAKVRELRAVVVRRIANGMAADAIAAE